MTTPFRAGRSDLSPGTHPADSVAVASHFTGQYVLMADVSEFEPNIADPTYVKDFSKAIIIRAAYGDAHDDKAWYGGARRADLHAAGVRFLGIYHYIVASQDITAQAKAFTSLLGKLYPGEYLIADIEEGSGSQQARWKTWASIVNGELGFAPHTYSGLSFAASHGLAPVPWVAAYQSAEPSEPHTLWQFTDAYKIPGVGTADCSIFHGSIDQLAALTYQGGARPPGSWAFPRPGSIQLGKQTRDGYTLSWTPVAGPGGQKPESYSVYTYDAAGKVANHQSVTATQASEYGPSGKGLPKGTYRTNVWANGGPLAPQGALLTVTLAD